MLVAAQVLAGMVIGVLLWGFAIEPRLIDEEHHVVRLADLPAAWDGSQVAFLADLQVGMTWANEGTARRMVERIVEDRPAAVLLGGDFLYSDDPAPAIQIATVLDIVGPLPEAGIPTFAVLGNHDVGLGVSDELARHLELAGIRVLSNEAVPLAPPGGSGAPLYVVGIGPHFAGRDRPARAVADVPDGAARVVFMHNPRSFPALPAGTAPLAVAGHTHGGQVRVPFTPEWSWLSLVRDEDVPVDGWADGYGEAGNRLYVNRGVGFSRIPFRLNCPPELTVFTLTP